MKLNNSILLVFVSIVFSLFLCEGILSTLNYPPIGLVSGKFVPFWVNQPGHGLMVQQSLQNVADPENVISAYEYDIDHALRLKSNIDEQIKAFAMSTKEIEERLPPWRIVTDTFHNRVWSDKRKVASDDLLIIMGGSSPFGWGVDFEDTFPAVMAQEEDTQVKVMNLAVPGYTIYDALLLYRKYRKTIRKSGTFRLILDAGSNNSGLSSVSDKDAHAYRRSWRGKLRLVLSRFRLYWLSKTFLNRFSYFQERFDTVRVSHKEYENYLKELLDMATKDGGNIVLLNMCNDDKTLIRLMKEEAAGFQIPFFDIDRYFDEIIESVLFDKFPELIKLKEDYLKLYGSQRIKEYPRWLVEFHKNCHPNKLGHILVAGKLKKLS